MCVHWKGVYVLVKSYKEILQLSNEKSINYEDFLQVTAVWRPQEGTG